MRGLTRRDLLQTSVSAASAATALSTAAGTLSRAPKNVLFLATTTRTRGSPATATRSPIRRTLMRWLPAACAPPQLTANIPSRAKLPRSSPRGGRTFANRDRGESRRSSPSSPPDKRVRIRRFPELILCQNCTGRTFKQRTVDSGSVARRVCSQASLAPNSLKSSAKADWMAQSTHETRFPTAPLIVQALTELLCPGILPASNSRCILLFSAI